MGKNLQFHRSFWVANGMELIERLAYYGQNAVFSIYLRDHLLLPISDAGKLQSLFGGLLYALPIIGGTVADLLGFRKAFMLAFLLLGGGYFLIGSTGIHTFHTFYSNDTLFYFLVLWILVTTVGGSFIKPAVLGTVAFTTTESSKSMGYAIYYWLVNIGAALGPFIAFVVRSNVGIEYVYLVSSISCIGMAVVTYFFYQDVVVKAESVSVIVKLRQLVYVLKNRKFLLLLLIFSLFWLMFWQIFIIIPFYIKDFMDKDAPFELIASAGAWAIIAFQLFITKVTKTFTPQRAIVTGFMLAACGWLLPALFSSIASIIVAIVVFSLGEMIQAPRYYEYIAAIAPPDQIGMYQGFAFIPVAIAYAIGGVFGTWLYEILVEVFHTPVGIWYVLFSIGCLASFLMLLYIRVVTEKQD